MKKKNIVVGAVLASLVAGLALTAAAAYDSSSDPLITLSYLRDVFKVELMNEVDEKLAGYTPSSGNSPKPHPQKPSRKLRPIIHPHRRPMRLSSLQTEKRCMPLTPARLYSAREVLFVLLPTLSRELRT